MRIPEYSITGDILSYLKCPRQYRYYNRGKLPPSKPVQQWFGEFIHGVMEVAYTFWKDSRAPEKFPWDWKENIRPIELLVSRRLESKGLTPPFNIFYPYEDKEPKKLIASERAELAINIWGEHLFPLITEAEVKLKANRKPGENGRFRTNKSMKKFVKMLEEIRKVEYYQITGVADVISSIKIKEAPERNEIVQLLHKNRRVSEIIQELKLSGEEDYEILVDYKGMRRPPLNSREWKAHEWQVLTYAWLRKKKIGRRKVVAGILIYINELCLSEEDMEQLYEEIQNKSTDVIPEPQGDDERAFSNWRKKGSPPVLSEEFRKNRSIRIIPIDYDAIDTSLRKFDTVVYMIEKSIMKEANENNIRKAWFAKYDEKNCAVCDFQSYCWPDGRANNQ